MKMIAQTNLRLAAFSMPFLLGIGLAAAQDADVRSRVEDLQQRYEEAVTGGDYETLGSMFSKNVIYLPMTGGMLEGPEQAQKFYEDNRLKSLDIHSSATETVGQDMILDIGTFTATLPDEAGGTEVEGEYVALMEEGDQGLQLRSLTSFSTRQALGAACQQ